MAALHKKNGNRVLNEKEGCVLRKERVRIMEREETYYGERQGARRCAVQREEARGEAQ